MRGINISSIIFLAFVLWNIVVLSFFSYKNKKTVKNKNSGIGVLATLCVNAVLIFGILYFSINIGVTHYSIKSDRLPTEFADFKILQISDFHTGSFYGGVTELIKKVEREKPDIIVLTGDLIDETVRDMSSIRELVSQLIIIAPVYFVSGNHDIWYPNYSGLKHMLKNKGVVLLENKKETLKRGNSHINLFGIDDPDTCDDTGSDQFLKQKINDFQQEYSYNILLFHRSNMFDSIKGKGFQLVLSGHMHGGQVQLPFVGGLVSPQSNRTWLPKYTDGKWEEAGTVMIVSRGLGNNVPVPRILNPPEVVVVTLRCK